jgi:DNA uptake protein ComE-like DNA-binding protein
MSPLGQHWKDALSMHRSERRGFMVLLAGCLAAAVWVTYEQWIRPPDDTRLAVLSTAMERWVEARRTPRDTVGEGRSRAERATLFPFDPNGLPVDQWMALGLSERQAAVIHKYEAGGGRFRSKRDVAKMRVVDPELFVQWAPFIQLPDSLAPREDPTGGDARAARDFPPRYVPRAVEVNSADSVALVAVPGIGPSFAKGIIKYRDRLGGFHSLDQLAEVYVLKDKPDAVATLKQRLVLDTLVIRRISVNTATVEELAAHPYLGWKVAKALVAYRGQHGGFSDVAGIKGCVLVNDSLFRKLAPYLTAP